MAQKKIRTKEELFETYSIPKAVLVLSVPTVLSSLVTVLYSLADTYFVGMVNDPIQTASVTLAAPVLLAFNAVNNLFGVGSSSMMSRAMGRRDGETVRRSSAFGFYGALICGAVFALLCTVLRTPLLGLLGAGAETAAPTSAYLNWTVSLGAVPAILNVVMAYMIRSEGAALHASVGTMSGCLLNIVLDPIFILPWGLDMKAEGAALATFLSNCVALAYFLVYLYLRRRSTSVSVSPRDFKLKRQIVSGVFAVGVPASVQNLLNVTGSMIMNNLAAVYGAEALAAMGICTKINMVPMYVVMGVAQGIMPLISYNYASGNIPRMKKAFFFTARIGVADSARPPSFCLPARTGWWRCSSPTRLRWRTASAFCAAFAWHCRCSASIFWPWVPFRLWAWGGNPCFLPLPASWRWSCRCSTSSTQCSPCTAFPMRSRRRRRCSP